MLVSKAATPGEDMATNKLRGADPSEVSQVLGRINFNRQLHGQNAATHAC